MLTTRPPKPLGSVLEGGGWSAPRPGRFTPGKDPVPILQEAYPAYIKFNLEWL
jgi:hypothetical protein